MSARGACDRWLRAGALIAVLATPLAWAGPVEVFREGARFCPRDRSADQPVLDVAQAIERARTLLPSQFCGPTHFVHQYRLRDARHDWGGLTHTYVILDAVGNCYANIPGTEQGAPR